MVVKLVVLIWSFKLVMAKQEGFIVGGEFVKSIKKFPHVAFLTIQSEDAENIFVCGSSILNQAFLITAAHCLDDTKGIVASVGNLDREKGKMHSVAKWTQHGKWDKESAQKMEHDIALCGLLKSITLGHMVQRVVLMKNPPKAEIADLAGWGAYEEIDYSETNQLKHTRQKLWSHEKCKEILKGAPKGTICGGESNATGNFASRGDSGSGLLINNNIIIGLVSFKYPHVSRSLVIYTDVPYYYNWIKRSILRLKCSQ